LPNELLNRRKDLMKTILVRAEATSILARGAGQRKGGATVEHHVELVSRMVCKPAASLEGGRLLSCSREVGSDPSLAIVAVRVKDLEGVERPARDRKLGRKDVRYLGEGWVHRGSVANTVKRKLVEHVFQEGSTGILSPKQVSNGPEGKAIWEKHVLEFLGPVGIHRGDGFVKVETQLGGRRKRLWRRGSQVSGGRPTHQLGVGMPDRIAGL
jgi:hypothetical protein